ncbi:hypothetical protein EES43_18390 [Streptomyces sp. ADI96-02]|nr:hypothetical protein EES43_18390 [Streptomyces sp. ADI96-02]
MNDIQNLRPACGPCNYSRVNGTAYYNGSGGLFSFLSKKR